MERWWQLSVWTTNLWKFSMFQISTWLTWSVRSSSPKLRLGYIRVLLLLIRFHASTIANYKSFFCFCSFHFEFLGCDVVSALAVSDSESSAIYIFDGKGKDDPLHVLDKTHSNPVKFIEVSFISFCSFLFVTCFFVSCPLLSLSMLPFFQSLPAKNFHFFFISVQSSLWLCYFCWWNWNARILAWS